MSNEFDNQDDSLPEHENGGGGKSQVPHLPVVKESRCHVCMSRWRDMIDRMVVMGYRPTHISRQVQEMDPSVSRKSVERHIARHLSYEQEAMRQLIEQQAEDVGALADEAKTRMVTRMAVLDRMIEKGWDQLLKEDGWVKYQDVLKAIELKSQFETSASSQIQDQLTRQLTAILQAIKQLVAPEEWAAIAQRAQEIYDAPLLEIGTGQ